MPSNGLVEDAPDSSILVSRLWIQGLVITGLCYGMVVSLCISCIRLLTAPAKINSNVKTRLQQRSWLLVYVVYILVLSTAGMAVQSKITEEAFVFHYDSPSGPGVYALETVTPYIYADAILFVFLQWAADGLLLWRCFALFTFTRPILHKTKCVTTVIISIITMCLSGVFVVCASSPQSLGPPETVNKLLFAYGSWTCVLNIAITGLILGKILRHRRTMRSVMGEDYGREYIGVVSILIESAAVLTAYNLFFLIPLIIGNPLSVIGREIGIMIQLFPPLMIIQRVAKGTAWSAEQCHSSDHVSTLRFSGQPIHLETLGQLEDGRSHGPLIK